MTATSAKRASRPLPGEDLTATDWEDARRWMGIYTDLVRFKGDLLSRTESAVAKLQPIARQAASADVTLFRAQLSGHQGRLDLWYSRLLELGGLVLDPERRTIRHRSGEAALTEREYQLLQFLLDHPRRHYSPNRSWPRPGRAPPSS